MTCLEGLESIAEFVEQQRRTGARIGFVPTMGALHPGHLSLVEQSGVDCDCTMVSIFVNPTQFNQSEDLLHYPRTVEADLSLLGNSACDAVFLPRVEEIYPSGPNPESRWDFNGLDKTMEGQFRPGHFDGVAQVVRILLQIVKPDILYLGQKDYQQYAIVKRMVEIEQLPVEVRVCPIVREPNGLAMSSRNLRLSSQGRLDAVALSRALFRAKSAAQLNHLPIPDPVSLVEDVRRELQANAALKLEYLEIVDADTLQHIKEWPLHNRAVLCVAAWVDGVRLIDNVLIGKPEPSQSPIELGNPI